MKYTHSLPTVAAYLNARDKGFWPCALYPISIKNTNLLLSKLMLVTTEVAEAAEAVRHEDLDNLAEELADVCIRVFDIAGAINLNLERAIADKMNANKQREHMHGGKKA